MSAEQNVETGARLVDVVIERGEQHGAPDSTVPVYELEDGTQVRGEARSIMTGLRRVGGEVRMVNLEPGEINQI